MREQRDIVNVCDVGEWPEWRDGNGRTVVYYTRYNDHYYAISTTMHYSIAWERIIRYELYKILVFHIKDISNSESHITIEPMAFIAAPSWGDELISERSNLQEMKDHFEVDIMAHIL